MPFTRGVGPVTAKTTDSFLSVSVVLNPVAVGNGIVIGVIWHDAVGNDPTSVTISGEVDATAIGLPVRSSALGDSFQIFYLGDIKNAGSKTVTVNFNVGVRKTIVALEYVSGDKAAFLDASATGAGTTGAPSISLTTATDNAAIFAIVGSDKSDPGPGGGYTGIAMFDNFWWTQAEDNLDAGPFGAKTVNFTTTGNGSWAIAAASFKLASGGGTTPVSRTLDVRWDLRASVGRTADARWGLRQIVARAADARWDLRALASKAADVRWGLRQTAARTLDGRWGLRQLAGRAADLRYDIQSALTTVGRALDARWAIRAKVGRIADARWGVRARVGRAADVRWGLRALAAKAAEARYAIRQTVGRAADVRYGARQLAGRLADVRWGLHNLVGRAGDVRYAIQALFTDQPAAMATASQSAATLATAATAAATATVAAQVPATLVTVTQEPAS